MRVLAMLAVSAAALPLVALAQVQAPPTTVAQTAPPAAATGQTAPAPAMTARAPAAAPATVTATADVGVDLDKIVCRSTPPPTGSRLGGGRECHTVREWNERTREEQQMIEERQTGSYRGPGGG
ncbi:MAG: hypothetical protein ACREHF_00910 [Rhizomicrobium sp.]